MVSTSVGVEGLEIEPGVHYVRADSAATLAEGLVELLRSPQRRLELAARARKHVESHFSNATVGRCFEAICLETLAEQLAPR